MRVRFDDPTLFGCGDRAVYDQLQNLFLRAYRGQHELDIDDPDSVLASEFMQIACTLMHRPYWEELIRRSPGNPFAPDPPRRCAVVARETGPREAPVAYVLAPERVGDWAEQPLEVFLENLRDGVLLRLAARVSGSDKINEALAQGWLACRGCGGTGEVQRAVEDARSLQRLFVIIDSDREDPEGEPSPKACSIRKACDDRGIPVHVLNRRELENYVPESIWRLVLGTRRSRSVRSAGGPEQRAVLVYRWLLAQIEDAEMAITKKYGKDAVVRVSTEIQRQAEKRLPARLLHELLDEWRALEPAEQKHVDDLKVRFGKGIAALAIEKLGDADFDAGWLDQQTIADLRQIAEMVEEWL